MICLDNTDTLEGGASVDAVVDYTVHGLVGTTFTNIAQGQLSNTDPSVLYTAGAAISIVSVIFVNTHSAAVTVNLYLDPANAGTPRRLIPKALSLGIGYSMHFDGARITVMNASGDVLHTIDNVTGLPGLLADDQHVLDTEVINLVYPVGSIYIAIVATNPGTLFGVGTWTAFGTGRVLVGLDAGQTEFDVVEETGGEKTHALTAAESAPNAFINSAGAFAYQLSAGGGNLLGSGTAHNNLQPYIVVYMWKRTA